MATQRQIKAQARIDAKKAPTPTDTPVVTPPVAPPVVPPVQIQRQVEAQARIDAGTPVEVNKPVSTVDAIRAARQANQQVESRARLEAKGMNVDNVIATETPKLQTPPVVPPTTPTVVPPNQPAPLTPEQEQAKKDLEAKGVDTTNLDYGSRSLETLWRDKNGNAPEKPNVPPVPVPPATQDEAYNILANGGTLVPSKESDIYKANYERYTSFAWLDDKSLINKIASKDFNFSDLENLQKRNPEKYARIQKGIQDAVAVGDINSSAQNLFDGWKVTVKRTSDSILEDVITSFNTTDQKYSDIVATAYEESGIGKMAEEVAAGDDKLQNLNDQKFKIQEDLRTQYPDVPQSMLMGMAARLTYDLDTQISSVTRQNSLAYAKYKDAKDMVDAGIGYDIKQQEVATQNKQQMMQFLYGTVKQDEVRDEDYARAEANIEKQHGWSVEEKAAANLFNLQSAVAAVGGNATSTDSKTLLAEYRRASKEKQATDIALQQRQLNISQQNADTSRISATQGNWSPEVDENWDSYSFDKNTGKKVYDNGVIPTWNLVSVNTGNKNVNVDSVAAPWLQSAITQMQSQWIYVLTWAADRDQAQTIKAMWDRVGMPWATAAQLRAKGHQIADVWQSNHEGGMAIDLYSNDKYGAPTQQQIAIMEQNGWHHPNIPWDAGHFEYKGNKKTDTQQSDNEWLITTILGSWSFTKQSRQDIITAIRKGDDPWTVIRNRAKSIMGAPAAKDLYDYEKSSTAFNNLADRIQKFYDAGGETSYMKWNFEKVINSFGNVSDPKLVRFATDVSAALQQYRNAISGTAYSEQEGKDIASIFPWIDKSKDLNSAIISARKEVFQSVADSAYRSVLGNGYDKLLEVERGTQEQNNDELSNYDETPTVPSNIDKNTLDIINAQLWIKTQYWASGKF